MTGFILLTIAAVAATFVAPVATGTGMINLAGWFILIMGMLFDLALKYLVVDFNAQIYTAIAGSLGQVWTAFRDMANIVIIGMFTSVAILTILGSAEYGAKKLVARILIIAVLINFSLLFTRIIIEASNFVAGKFYSVMALDSITNPASANAPAPGLLDYAGTAGISGQFINLLGLPSALDARETVASVYAANAPKNIFGQWVASAEGGITAIIYGFTAAVLMIAVGLVLGYAVFLLVTRTVLFLFLLSVSALAFASYLVPHWGDKYWSMWWSALLRNAVFGPLLMLMLWATLTISYALVSGSGQARSFDKLFSDPTSGSGVLALLIFLIILGMLFACIKFASSFSTKIAGFGASRTAWAGIPLGLGAGLGGLLGRNVIGRAYAQRSESLGNDASKTRRALGSLDKNNPNYERRRSLLESRLTGLEDSKKFADKLANSKFAFGGTGIGKKMLKATGTPASLAGDGKKAVSFGEFQKKTSDEAAKRAVEITKLSSADTDAIRKGATEIQRGQRDILQQNIQTAKAAERREETSRAGELQRHEDDMRDAAANRETIMRTQPPGAARDADLNREKNRIDNARQQINDLRKQLRKNAGLDTLEGELKKIDKTIETSGKDAVKAAKENVQAVGENIAEKIAYGRPTNILPWASGGNPKNDQTAQKARSAYKNKVGDSGEDDRLIESLRRKIVPPTTP